jgi:hypothetical protein
MTAMQDPGHADTPASACNCFSRTRMNAADITKHVLALGQRGDACVHAHGCQWLVARSGCALQLHKVVDTAPLATPSRHMQNWHAIIA